MFTELDSPRLERGRYWIKRYHQLGWVLSPNIHRFLHQNLVLRLLGSSSSKWQMILILVTLKLIFLHKENKMFLILDTGLMSSSVNEISLMSLSTVRISSTINVNLVIKLSNWNNKNTSKDFQLMNDWNPLCSLNEGPQHACKVNN